MKPGLSLILIVAVAHCCYSQTDTTVVRVNKRSIGFNVGFAHHRLVDEGLSFSKLLFRGTTPKLHLDYSSKASRHLVFSSLEVSGGKLKSKEGKTDAEITNIQLLINYSTKIRYSMFGKKHELFAGLQLGSTAYYIDSPDLDNEDILTLSGLYLTLMENIPLGRSGNIQLQLTIPTAGFVKRLYADGGLNLPASDPPVFNILYGDSKFSFLSTLQFSAAYTRPLTPLTDLSVRYCFTYLSNSSGQMIRTYSNEIQAGFKFYFRK